MNDGGFVKSKSNIYDHLVYNCLELNWREHNMLYQEPLKILEGEVYKNYEGIYFDEIFTEKNNLYIMSNEEINKIFETVRKNI